MREREVEGEREREAKRVMEGDHCTFMHACIQVYHILNVVLAPLLFKHYI